jgi:hypothetical protein
MRRQNPVDPPGLKAINRLVRFQILEQAEVVEHITATRVNEKNRRPVALRLDGYKTPPLLILGRNPGHRFSGNGGRGSTGIEEFSKGPDGRRP